VISVVKYFDVKRTEEDKEAEERLEASLKLRDTWRRVSKSVVQSTQGVRQTRFVICYLLKFLKIFMPLSYYVHVIHCSCLVWPGFIC